MVFATALTLAVLNFSGAEAEPFPERPSDFATMEEFCRICHCDPLESVNIHHLKTYTDGTNALNMGAVVTPNPLSSIGTYSCYTCHQQVYNQKLYVYEFLPFRDCTICHVPGALSDPDYYFKKAHHAMPSETNPLESNRFASDGNNCFRCHKIMFIDPPSVCYVPPPPPAEICDDLIDNDGDGFVDCADEECGSTPGCLPPVEICDDGIDNDGDGYFDCVDSECASFPYCLPEKGNCRDGYDNDRDGKIDCSDRDCAKDSACR